MAVFHPRARPQPECDATDHASSTPILVCPIGRGWLIGWVEIARYCGFGKSMQKGTPGSSKTGSQLTGRRWEKRYGLPVHRLPDGTPRAIPYELDQWLIAFSQQMKEAKIGRRPPSKQIHTDWRRRRADSAGQAIGSVRQSRDQS
jgi:hypothetical protein